MCSAKRLAATAREAGIDVVVQADPKLVTASEIAPGTDLIVTAHSHARVSGEALALARLGGIGYHPSLLPRHRGIAAVEWTIKEGDPIAGGTIYHLADRMDAGAIAHVVKMLQDQEVGWRNWLAEEQIDAIDVAYQVLWRNLTSIVATVLESVGQDPRLAPAPVLERQANQRSDEWVDRYRADAEKLGLPQ